MRDPCGTSRPAQSSLGSVDRACAGRRGRKVCLLLALVHCVHGRPAPPCCEARQAGSGDWATVAAVSGGFLRVTVRWWHFASAGRSSHACREGGGAGASAQGAERCLLILHAAALPASLLQLLLLQRVLLMGLHTAWCSRCCCLHRCMVSLCALLLVQVQVSSSPVYATGRRLGKGGFGQVFLGTRAQKPRSAKDQKPVEVGEAHVRPGPAPSAVSEAQPARQIGPPVLASPSCCLSRSVRLRSPTSLLHASLKPTL